ncbi:hypothetical protein AAMO2058_001097500 [Amorphochlora amoebiformis]
MTTTSLPLLLLSISLPSRATPALRTASRITRPFSMDSRRISKSFRRIFRLGARAKGDHVDGRSEVSRRRMIDGVGMALSSMVGAEIGIPVGQYLPSSPVPNRFRFTPAKDSTPSIRGRVLRPQSYTLDLPGDWKAVTVGVIQTGDFCQPKCDEPWTEVKFEGKGTGKAKVMMVPSFRLTTTEQPKLEDIGDPEEVIQKIGPFVTGDYYDGEDMPTVTTVSKSNGQTYYTYVIESPGAVNGPHNIAVVSVVPGPTDRDRYHAIMVVASANNAEWDKGSAEILSVAKSFSLTATGAAPPGS